MADFKTYSKKAGEVEHKWVLVDVANIPTGRAATFIAQRLSGKYQPSWTAHIDSGDYVVVINADKLVFRGDLAGKTYYRHSGFPGALHEISAKTVPMSEVLERAVKGMLPKNKLQADRLARLRIFANETHDHTAQTPEKIDIPMIKKSSRKEDK